MLGKNEELDRRSTIKKKKTNKTTDNSPNTNTIKKTKELPNKPIPKTTTTYHKKLDDVGIAYKDRRQLHYKKKNIGKSHNTPSAP